MPTEKTSSKTEEPKKKKKKRSARDADIETISKRVRSRIKRASQYAQNQNVLIYGRPGAKKTRFCATAPEVLIIDVNEEGTDSVRRDIDPMTIRVYNWEDFRDIYWFAHEGNHEFESFAIDGVTALQILCMRFVLGERHDMDSSRDPDMPNRPAWGKVGKLMSDEITNWRNLPYNVIFTATERSREIEDEGGADSDDEVGRIIGPNVSPTVASSLEQAVGTIGRMVKREVRVKTKVKKGDKKVIRTRREVRSRLLVADSERYVSKDRNGVFGEFIDAPDFAEMLKLIYQKEE